MRVIDPAIDIILDGKRFAFRTWPIIPRVGDNILLRDGEISAVITRVVWGDDSSYHGPGERQWIQLVCKTIESITDQKTAPT
jgi:hypothetical protein